MQSLYLCVPRSCLRLLLSACTHPLLHQHSSHRSPGEQLALRHLYFLMEQRRAQGRKMECEGMQRQTQTM